MKKDEPKVPAELNEANSLVSLTEEFKSVFQDEDLKEQILSSPPLRIPLLTGGAGMVKIGEEVLNEFLAVIFASRNINQYWELKQLLCYSEDGIKPEIDSASIQSDYCARCKFAQFGTAADEKGEKRRGKKCKNMIRLYLVLSPALSKLPALIHIPPTSLKSWIKYKTLMSSKLLPIHKNFTKIKIGKDTFGGYPVTTIADFVKERDLLPDELKIVEFLKGIVKKVKIEAEPEDYSGDDVNDPIRNE